MNLRRSLPLACLLSLASPAVPALDLGPVTLGATLQYDVVSFDLAPAPLEAVDGWRRQEFAASGKLGERLEFKLVYAGQSGVWSDAYLRMPLGKARLSLGQFKIPFGADWLSSSSQLLFTERGAGGVFAPGRRLGLQLAMSGAGWGGQFAAYGQNIEGNGPDAGLAVRGWLYRGDPQQGYWHLALAGTREAPSQGNVSFSLRPEIGSFGPSWESSGRFRGIDDMTRSGLEAGWQRGDLAIFGEWARIELDGSGPSRSGQGGMLQASWTVHGEPRRYAPGSGLFTGPKGVEGLGQVELALRYNRFSLPHANGGDIGQRGPSLGLNLQYGPYLRLMLDRHLPQRQRDAADAQLWVLRAGLLF
jgi:phosphate-selective porin